MAETANFDIIEAKIEGEKRSQAHEKIKELIPWEMIENKIKNP
jgi:hypothetical protein